MAATCGISAATISDLPSEVLSHIFTFLPYNLKVVRLVCTKWNESCNTEKVSGHEKITIDANGYGEVSPKWSTADIDEFFGRKRFLRNIYQLSLWDVALKTQHVKFFERFGDQLRSLSLTNCDTDEYVPFLEYCKHLKFLDFNAGPESPLLQSFRHTDGSFVQTNIISLNIGYCDEWSDESMDTCFRICPRLRSLSFHWLPGGHSFLAENEIDPIENGGERVFNRSDILSFSCKYHAISVRAATIVELDFLGVSGILPELFEKIASIPNLRLRKLSLSHDALSNRNIYNIVNAQRDLRKIDIGVLTCDEITSNGMADWIGICWNVTDLSISTCSWHEFILDAKLLDALTSRPHLRKLRLLTGRKSVIGSDIENSRGTFNHLRALVLDHPNYIRVLERVSDNLEDLSFGREVGISRETLEFISNRFTNLETLSLIISRSDLCDDDSVGQISPWNFGKLRTLIIESPISSQDCFSLTSLLRRFEAPNLRFLELSHFNAVDVDSLLDMVTKYPLMENFAQSCRSWPEKVDSLYLQVASGWKRLYSFRCDGTEYLHLHRRRENEDKFYSSSALPISEGYAAYLRDSPDLEDALNDFMSS